MPGNEVTVCLIGETGMGKSSFGNLYLEDSVFEVSDSIYPVSMKPTAQSRKISGYKRWVIDTEGLNDGISLNSAQIQTFAKFMAKYERGVNGVAIIINGQLDRFSQGLKEIIKFTYNSFATDEILSHMCIVFTKCYVGTIPNRQKKQSKYTNLVRKYLSEISGLPLQQIPEIPIFFVDCYYEQDDTETVKNMTLFHGWICSRDALDTENFREAYYREDRVLERRKHVSVGFETRGDIKYELFEDQERIKIVPNNKDPIRYTEWECIDEYEEPVEKVTYQIKNDVDLGYEISKNQKIRYKVYVDQERKIVRNLRTGKIIEKTPWYNISDKRKVESGRASEKIKRRYRKFEIKEVEHHHGHGFFGGNDHTHYKFLLRMYQEQRTIKTDYDGNKTYSDWLIVPGSESIRQVGGEEEGGWTSGYEREIDC